jgi:hypothetical protein
LPASECWLTTSLQNNPADEYVVHIFPEGLMEGETGLLMLGQRGSVTYLFPISEPSSPSSPSTCSKASWDQPLAHGKGLVKLFNFQTGLPVTISSSLSSLDMQQVEPPSCPIGNGSSTPMATQTLPPGCNAALPSPLRSSVLAAINFSLPPGSPLSTLVPDTIDGSLSLSSAPSTLVPDAIATVHTCHKQASQLADERGEDTAQQVDDLNSEDGLNNEDIAGNSEWKTCLLIVSP